MIIHAFLFCKLCMKKFYYEQLAKIVTCVKYLINAYHRFSFPTYISLFPFGNLDSLDYHGDPLNVVFTRFPNCFIKFPLMFPHVSFGVSTVPLGVFPVSSQCSTVS